jgi:TRAP-type mannitol/chloroaromatic compound transport system permease large subunit
LIEELFAIMPGGVVGATLVVMLVIFLLGFILDFIEITFMVVPLVGPVLLGMGLDPVWLGVMIAINLQTSFLTPPFGFSLVLFTQCSASRSGNRRYLSRCDSLRYLAATVADLACLSARTSNLAAISA